MPNDEWKIFEINLIDKYIKNPNAELAETLVKEYSAHKLNNSDITKELTAWIRECKVRLSKDKINISKSFGLDGKWGRSNTEIKCISMNAYIWDQILDGALPDDAYGKISRMFDTTADDAKIGFERKNHDFGERELSRLGLDIFIAMNEKKLTPEEINIASKHLKEDVSVQMLKDLNHHRMKYKITY